MALIQCSECQAEVSDKAESCPKCGNPIGSALKSAQPANKKGRNVFALVVLFLVIAGVMSIMESSPPNTSATPSTASLQSEGSGAESAPQQSQAAAAEEPPIKMSALDLYNDYHANEVAADGKYRGRILAIHGVVTTIGKDVLDKPYVALAADNEFDTVNAYFGKDKIDQLAQLKKGDIITVTCRGNGMTIGSPILQCD